MDGDATMTRAQVREFDRRATEEWGVPGVVLMENAGRNAAAVAMNMLSEASGQGVAVLCGPGNNGGDGFVVARHLRREGVPVTVYLMAEPRRVKGDAQVNMNVWRQLGGTVTPVRNAEQVTAAAAQWADASLIVDGLLGTGFSGVVRQPLEKVIRCINGLAEVRVLALDLPSGLDCDTGRPCATTVRADTTVTFVARKTGFDTPGAEEFTGRVIVADIGVPLC